MFSESWTIARRDLLHWRQQPGAVLVNLLFPVMIMLMFGWLFGGAISGPEGNYFDFLLPGMLTLGMFFGLEATKMAVTTDAERGITDRFRSLPISGVAVVLGRCLADLMSSVAGLLALAVAGFALGWRWHDGPVAAAAAFGLLILLRFALLWVGVLLGLVWTSPESVMAVQILVWPVGFVSSVFVDPATMPWLLGVIAEWNPISATATAVRDLFGTPGWETGSWAAAHAVPMSILWAVVLTAAFLPLSARAFRRFKS